MIFNLSNREEVKKAQEYLNGIIRLGKKVEIKRKSEARTLPQNSYLHLVLGYYGTETGYTLEEAKTKYKRLNSDIYVYEKRGEKFLRSSADLTKEEMQKSIDRFIQVVEETEGIPLPRADNQDFLDLAANSVEAHMKYL